LLLVLVKYRKMIIGITVAAALVSVGVALNMPNIYTATARILPPQQGQSSSMAMLGQLGSLAGAAGGALGIKNPNDLYIGMMKSRTLTDNIVARFKLKEVYKQDFLTDARATLQANVKVIAGKDGIIAIDVDDEDPKRAADIANAYVDELYKLTQNLAVTEASQRRLFFEKQLKLAKDELVAAEIAMKKTQEQTGIIKLEGQAEAIIKAVAELRAQIAATEVNLGAMRMFATLDNPDYVRRETELAGLRTQLAAMEKAQGPRSGDVSVSTRKMPEVGLEYVRKLRDVKYSETIFELMAKQYEIAKVDEAKNTSMIQVLDAAVSPERKSKPKRANTVFVGTLVASFMAMLLAFGRASMAKATNDPNRADRMTIFRRALKA